MYNLAIDLGIDTDQVDVIRGRWEKITFIKGMTYLI